MQIAILILLSITTLLVLGILIAALDHSNNHYKNNASSDDLDYYFNKISDKIMDDHKTKMEEFLNITKKTTQDLEYIKRYFMAKPLLSDEDAENIISHNDYKNSSFLRNKVKQYYEDKHNIGDPND